MCMWTIKNPTHCPKCLSEKVCLEKISDKDEKIKKEISLLGVWYCTECGNMIGRKMNQYENDIDEKSL